MRGWVGKGIRRLAAEVLEFRRWEALRDAQDIRVFYGMDRLPFIGEPISGGIVKCLDLAERFPNSPDKANLLYLVSSALPDRRELMARAAQRAGGRFVLNQNGVAYPAWAGPAWRQQNAPNAHVHELADHVVYQSEFCRRCAERFLGPRKGPGEVLYNPVDTKAFVPRPEIFPEAESPVLLVAGSHHEGYRVQVAIDALSLVREYGVNARLRVAGRLVWSRDAETEARCWAREAGLESVVEFSGPYSQAEAPALFQQSHVLIHAKVQDPCPRLVVEAMACGLPVVYSATGGVPELVGSEAGVGITGTEDFEVMHPPAAEAVAEAILNLLMNRGKLARQARERALRLFSAEAWVKAHARIFQSLVPRGER